MARKVTARYGLLVRGVNVGTKNSLPMAELRGMLEAIGCTEVETYVQSGNAALSTTLGEAALTTKIEAALERYMGRPIKVVLRTRAALDAIVEGCPFAALAADPRHLCVTFFSAPPSASALAALEAGAWAPERYEARGAELYSYHPDGQGKSKLALAIAKLPVSGALTTRNWRTVLALRDLVAGPKS